MTRKSPEKDEGIIIASQEEEEEVKEPKENLEVIQEPSEDDVTIHRMVTTMTPDFINNCPSEILAIVFKLAVSDNPTHVRRILLVCKHWYNLVINDPQMWNVIILRVPEDCWDVRGWARSTRQFVRKSLQRSQSALLEIKLDFDYLQTTRQQIAIKLDNSIWDLPGAADPEVIQRRIQKLRENDPQEPGSRLMVCEPDHALELVNDLVGPNGTFTTRWRTLEVIFPMGDTAWRLWNLILHPFPNLSRVSFSKLSRLGTMNWGAKDSSDYFPQVEQLRLDVDGNSTIFSLFPLSLRNLAVRTTFGSEFPRQLSRFTQLRALSINAGMGKLKDGTEVRLSLPVLQELSFAGNFQPAVPMQFDAPQLTHLLIEWSWRWKLTKSVPSLRPAYLQWAPRDEPQGKGEFALAQNFMHGLLLHFTATEHFTAPNHMQDTLLELVKELSPDGFLTTAWKTLSFHNGQEVVETVEFSEAMKWPHKDTE
jgi:hypothetical protein